MRFRLLAGSHAEGGNLQPDGSKTPLIVYHVGAIIESAVDLCKVCNSPGSIKFEQLDDAQPIAPAGAEPNLDRMNLKQLRALAEEEEVDLDPAATRDQIIAVLRTAMAAV